MVPKAEISVNNHNSTTVCHKETKKSTNYFKTEVKWFSAFAIIALHIAAVYFVFTYPFLQKKHFQTFLFGGYNNNCFLKKIILLFYGVNDEKVKGKAF